MMRTGREREKERLFDMHGGDVYRNHAVYDASVNLNPLGMPEAVKQILRESVDGWARYPDPCCQELVYAIGRYYKGERQESFPSEQILCGNGAADLIFQLTAALKPKRALVTAPGFSEYERALRAAGCEVRRCLLEAERGFAPDFSELVKLAGDAELVFFCNPNNPTGILSERPAVKQLAEACMEAGAALVVDECFMELSDDPEGCSAVPLLSQFPNLMVLKAFTKTYAMAGLRLGFLLCGDPDVKTRMEGLRQPWTVSVPAQLAGIAALEQEEYLQEGRGLIQAERKRLFRGLSGLGLTVFPSRANYLLFSVPEEDKDLGARLRAEGVLIRDCENFNGLEKGFYRICVGLPEQNRLLLEKMKGALRR
ncbi:MAG: pyridoxal phosphate-dependent class II aminotransferase [Eubacteriales bacterium]|nr:pyridoxal phosphate-dependent class II aminotransferase [Eubacteriales bacterium]